MENSWADVDAFLERTLEVRDPLLDGVLAANRAAGLPAIDVAPTQGRLLALLARIAGARTVLEIGTLGAYSTIWLARGLPDDGRIVTLEASPRHAEVATANLARAGLAGRVEVRIGAALDTLAQLKDEQAGPYDLVFIDADKPNNANYLRAILPLSHPGTVVVVDNVIRGGTVPTGDDPAATGAREALALLGSDPSFDATALQTVGAKGWDGFAIAVIR